MATVYGDGKAGQYAKSQANRYTEKLLNILTISLTLSSFIVGISLGFLLSRQAVARSIWARRIWMSNAFWVPIAVEAFIAGGALLSLRLLREPLNKMHRERLQWLRGGQIEGFVAWLLRDLLHDGWHLFNNVPLRTGGDLDHVLIGPGGVFCISTKSHKGTYSLSDGRYLLNGEPTAELEEAKKMAMKLRNWLEVKLPHGPIPWVQPILAAPFAYVAFPSYQNLAWLLNEDGLEESLGRQPRKLDQAAVAACVEALRDMTGLSPKAQRGVEPAQ